MSGSIKDSKPFFANKAFSQLDSPSLDFDIRSITRDYKLADYQYEKIMDEIRDFEKELDDEHEIAMMLASFGQNILLHVIDIAYANPTILYFYGYVNGKPSTLIQHVSQLNFLLTAVEKLNPYEKPHRIGFVNDSEEA